MPSPRVVLASSSPRRRELLSLIGIAHTVSPAELDETVLPGEAPAPHAERLARAKATAVAERLGDDPGVIVIGADTIVVVDGDTLGKPRDDGDAREMIARLSGRSHEVATGIAIARAGQLLEDAVVVTEVRFRALDPREIDGYVASGEGRDKAGAYGVQGLASALVSEVRGSYHNVVGLPAAETILALRRVGALTEWP